MFSQISDFLANTPLWTPQMIAILIGVGAFVGFINTIAGLATAISYWLFMAMGMPINIANATTRFGVLMQFSATSAIFKKEGYLDLKVATKVGIPVAIGAFAGAELAAYLPAGITEIVMAVMLPLMVVLLLIDKKKVEKKFSFTGSTEMTPLKYVVFTLIGIYGGFTHAGVGLLIMFGSFIFLGLDMIRSNAIKQFAVVIYTPIALLIFALHGQINWPVAIIYSVGNIIGGIIASKVAIKWGERFIKISVGVVVITMSLWLIFKNI
ncbi:MAG: sulfite exporter TauE/SafE family protein [Bacteroidales bacterium]|nr:sulfite exporter TauE/SafE family protein [Bacteroidales bacterium]